MAAVLIGLTASCSKGDASSDNNQQSTPSEQGGGPSETVDPEWDYPENPRYELVFYRIDDGSPVYTPLTSKMEFDGNSYFIAVYNKQTEKIIAGDKNYAIDVKILNGDDIFNIKVNKLTVNEYHVCTLTPKALGSCTLAVKVWNPSSEDGSIYVQKVNLSVVREKAFYLGLENSSSLPANKLGFYSNTLEYRFCWKVNDNGKLTTLNLNDTKKFLHFYTGSTLTVSEALSSDGTHVVYTVKRPSASTSFLEEPVAFFYNEENAVYARSVIFTTYSFTSY
ncbi:MAG: hypothetical protein J6Y31_05355 [Bacteroidales bacterium]|nr:hypothetical protein [Bacteroidales bacterium]